jgi:hypothetical protein
LCGIWIPHMQFIVIKTLTLHFSCMNTPYSWNKIFSYFVRLVFKYILTCHLAHPALKFSLISLHFALVMKTLCLETRLVYALLLALIYKDWKKTERNGQSKVSSHHFISRQIYGSIFGLRYIAPFSWIPWEKPSTKNVVFIQLIKKFRENKSSATYLHVVSLE